MPTTQPADPLSSSFLRKWASVQGPLKRALSYSSDTHDTRSVLDRILTRGAVIFFEGSSFMVCELQKYPKNKVCRVWLSGGKMDEVHDLGERVVQWAIEQGCDQAEIIGRAGWERAAPGFAKTATVYRRQLT